MFCGVLPVHHRDVRCEICRAPRGGCESGGRSSSPELLDIVTAGDRDAVCRALCSPSFTGLLPDRDPPPSVAAGDVFRGDGLLTPKDVLTSCQLQALRASAQNSTLFNMPGGELPKLCIGNTHKNIAGAMPHRWTLFVRGEDGKKTSNIGVKEVVFHIHQDYTPDVILVKKAPFEITRNGYGAFEVAADVTRIDGTASRELWTLNFDKPESFRVCGEDEWKMHGHRWIGQSVPRELGGVMSWGKVTRWMPPGKDPKEDFALWHVVHNDGDEEDLEEWEMREALALARDLKQNPQEEPEDEQGGDENDVIEEGEHDLTRE